MEVFSPEGPPKVWLHYHAVTVLGFTFTTNFVVFMVFPTRLGMTNKMGGEGRRPFLSLVLRPHDCVIECPPGFLAGKIPLDHDLIAIRATVPSSRFPPQRGAISDPAATQALPGVKADGDLCLVQPTAMLRGVVPREPLPQPLALLRAETLDDRL